MKSVDEVWTSIITALALISGHPVKPNELDLKLTGIDHMDWPAGVIQKMEPISIFRGIYIPEWFWRQCTKDMIAATVAAELVNCYFIDFSPIETAIHDEVAELDEKFEGREHTLEYRREHGAILARMEIDDGGWLPQLARKLKGDAELPTWLIDAHFNPQGLVDVFRLSIESAGRVMPARRIPYRTAAFSVRLQHLLHILSDRNDAAEAIRDTYHRAAERHVEWYLNATNTPSAVS